jgi:hypothetical protein
MIESIFYVCSVFLFFGFAAFVAWALDRILIFHFEGMERVKKLTERERERANK